MGWKTDTVCDFMGGVFGKKKLLSKKNPANRPKMDRNRVQGYG
jgi:hypothetical protein